MQSLMLALTILGSPALAVHGPYKVTCKSVPISGLRELMPIYRSARICFPVANGTFPLHLFAHGTFGGGAFFYIGYRGLQEQIASFGFVVPSYLSCWLDRECNNGQASFLEALKTIEFLEQTPRLVPVDWSKPYSVSGHSSGGRVALMLGALRDNAAYLANTTFASQITPSMRTSIGKIKAIIADHPDPMYDPQYNYNPDIANFNIKELPVLVITGSRDTLIEPKCSTWKDFQMLSTRDKVFINVHGAGHLEPNWFHREGPFIAYFAQYFALGDVAARAKIYGSDADSLQKTLQLAQPGDANNGDGKVAFVACSQNGTAVPKEYAQYCGSNISLAATIVV